MSFKATADRLAARVMRVLGNDVVIGVLIGKGQLMAPTERVIDGQVITTGWELEYQIADFPVIVRGSLVIVDGVYFTAREDGTVTGDGATGMLLLQRQTDHGEVELTIDGNTQGDVDLIIDGNDP